MCNLRKKWVPTMWIANCTKGREGCTKGRERKENDVLREPLERERKGQGKGGERGGMGRLYERKGNLS